MHPMHLLHLLPEKCVRCSVSHTASKQQFTAPQRLHTAKRCSRIAEATFAATLYGSPAPATASARRPHSGQKFGRRGALAPHPEHPHCGLRVPPCVSTTVRRGTSSPSDPAPPCIPPNTPRGNQERASCSAPSPRVLLPPPPRSRAARTQSSVLPTLPSMLLSPPHTFASSRRTPHRTPP